MIERLRHYFSTYKLVPGHASPVEVKNNYGRETALEVVEASLKDYEQEYVKFSDL